MADKILNIVLEDLGNGPIEDTWPYAISKNIGHNDIVSAVKKLDAENYCDSKVIEVNFHEITNDGLDCIKNGSPEVRVFNAVPAEEELWKASCDR